MVIGALGHVCKYYFWTWRWYLNFWYSSVPGSSAFRRTVTAFCSKDVLRQYICTSEQFLVIFCDTLFRGSKLIFSTFESAATYRFLCIKDVSFNLKMLLKLIHFMSFNMGVTWSRFKYFPLLATYAATLTHFCTSFCSFSLHLPHIELVVILRESRQELI